MSKPLKIGLLFATIIGSLYLLSGTVSADGFNQNRIIDDIVFNNANSMSASQINTFLNNFPNSCISPNSGFGAIDPTGYNPNSGFQYGGFVTAGQVIYDAAQAYSINPQVLIVTLEKEQSLITGQNNFSGYCNNGDQHKYAAATGYGCPDSGTTYNYTGLNLYQRSGATVTSTGTTCVNTASKAGFTQQVIRAAWLLKFGEQRSEGNVSWAVVKGNWDNSDDPQTCYGGPMTQGTFARCPSGGSSFYDGYTTIDGVSVHMDDGATAALYWYTPHFHGNQLFYNLFTAWFGSTDGSNSLAYVDMSGYPTVKAGQSASFWIRYKNTGQGVLYDDISKVSNITLHLADTNPINRVSQFYDPGTWINNNRPSTQFAAVYESDGTTLATNQHVVQPGQIVKFDFNYKASAQATSGTYTEYVQLVLEGASNWNIPGGFGFFVVTVP